MEPDPSNTSAPSSFYRIFHAVRGHMSSVGLAMLMSIGIGGCILYGTYRLPYNRLVVFNQPTSTAVRITSAKLQKPGYIVIYMQGDGGWIDVGASYFLREGYYRDIIVDIGYQSNIQVAHKDVTVGNFTPRNFVARIIENKGKTYVFDPLVDTTVLTKNGTVYQKKFWWEARGNPVKNFIVRLEDDPLVFLFDSIFP